ncbi:MAG: hypothetical protein BGN88_06800 [Clostridiales bacterium 43-6]|nr:MAG: hypothetical protein BGN88_06800 [Clostridiales bacterium 43-6]
MSVFSGEFILKQTRLLKRLSGQVFFRKKGFDELLVYHIKAEKGNDTLLGELTVLLEKGKLNEGENRLFEEFDENPSGGNFAAGVLFYQKMLGYSDEELKEWDFSLLELCEGFAELCDGFGIEEIL